MSSIKTSSSHSVSIISRSLLPHEWTENDDLIVFNFNDILFCIHFYSFHIFTFCFRIFLSSDTELLFEFQWKWFHSHLIEWYVINKKLVNSERQTGNYWGILKIKWLQFPTDGEWNDTAENNWDEKENELKRYFWNNFTLIFIKMLSYVNYFEQWIPQHIPQLITENISKTLGE